MIDTAKHVLITGAQGFTGCYMAAELRNHGYRVSGIGAQASNSPGYYQADIADTAALRSCLAELQPDIIIHLAAVAFVGHGDANAFYKVNLIGTRNLLEAISAVGKVPDCVLLASSANVYGNASAGVIGECSPLAPTNDYAVSKMAMEAAAQLWVDRLPLLITRPFNYTGVGQTDSFLLPKIVSHFRRKAPRIELGNLDVYRDFTDVRALTEAYRRLIESKPAGEVVNICSGVTHSLRDVIALCEAITGHSMEIRVNPAFVRANEVKSLCGDATRLRRLIGDWKTPPLEETLRWMLEAK